MTRIRGFRAVRPIKKLAYKVVSLPYDDMNFKEGKEVFNYNPYSFCYLDGSRYNKLDFMDMYERYKYKGTRTTLSSMISDGILVQDKKECMYIYRIMMNGISKTGMVCCVSIDDYIHNNVIKHEHTREDKEQDILNHIDYCDANTSPVLLTYRENMHISSIIKEWTKKEAIYHLVTEDMMEHTVWIIDDEDTINTLIDFFYNINYVYIADGHHRIAAATKVCLKRRESNPDFTGSEEFNFFLSAIFPTNELTIMPYNKVVKDLNGITSEKFLEIIEEKFYIFNCDNKEPYIPKEKHTFGLYLEGKWHKIVKKECNFNLNNPIDRLDVSILYSNILSPILGIQDERTDSRIDFIDGLRGLSELEKRVNNDMKVGFSLYPISLDDVMYIGDIGKVMPPKSTCFEPKLRSGLFIYRLK